jgi:serine/threonine-protein kinase
MTMPPEENQSLPVLNDRTYRIEARLGAGGGAVVYKAWHTRLDKYVVLKRIKDGSKLLAASHMRSEADILKNLKHTNLPQLYDFLIDESGVYTVMEFIPGKSFQEVLAEGAVFTQPQVIFWARQLTSALAYLHGQKPQVLHGDINPRNIMLDTEGNLCLIDFNISLVLDGKKIQALGISQGYAAPEQYPDYVSPDMASDTTVLSDTTVIHEQTESASAMDARSDLYSVGATLYHLITGTKPAAPGEHIQPLRSFDIPISEALLYLIERCMEYDPAKRFRSARDVHHALTNLHTMDRRWKRQIVLRNLAVTALCVMYGASVLCTVQGWRRMRYEKMIAYDHYVSEIAASDDDAAYEAAVRLNPRSLAAYREQALKLRRPGSYDQCIDFTTATLSRLTREARSASDDAQLGDMYFIQGNAFFETEDYVRAMVSYEYAMIYNPHNPEMKRDYAIAAVRTGNMAKANTLYKELHEANPNDGSLKLLGGEIAYANGSYALAIHFIDEALLSTDNEIVRYRAYMLASRAYRRMDDAWEKEKALLARALTDLPGQYGLAVKERLADAYARGGQWKEAVALFEKVRQMGNVGFSTWQNIGLLYQQMGDYDKALDVFNAMNEAYPNDFRPPMRMAYLELARQSARDIGDRDYFAAAAYFKIADRFCRQDDMEMAQLRVLMQELENNGWLNG